MIPDDVNIYELVQELDEDKVFLGSLGEEYPHMEQELIGVTQYAEERGLGDMRIAVLDQIPEHTSDLRDIAQELLNGTGANLVVVRNPASGAVVSTENSRAVLEAAQFHFLRDPDYVRASRFFVDYVSDASLSWWLVFAIVLAGILLVIGGSWFVLTRQSAESGTSTHS